MGGSNSQFQPDSVEMKDDGQVGSVQLHSPDSFVKPSSEGDSQPKSTWRLFFARSLFMYFGYMCMGLIISEGGTTFLDLLLVVKSDVGEGSVMYTAGSIGYACGALVAGFLYDLLTWDGLFFLSVLSLGLLNVGMGYCPTLWLLSLVSGVRGLSLGSMDTGGNTIMVGMWKDEGSPYLQALHFSFSIGGVISPFLVAPFLAPKANHTNSSTSANFSVNFLHNESSGLVYNLTEAYHPTETRVQYAYLIIGALTVASSLPFLILFLRNAKIRRKPNPQTNKSCEKKSNDKEMPERAELSLPRRIVLLIFLGMFYMFYVCLESVIEGYLMTFVVKHLDWSKPDGANITSIFWGTFAGGRLLGIITSKFLTPWKMLFIDLILVNGILIPLWFVHPGFDILVWVCIPLSGAFMATIFPTGISWTDQKIMRVSGKVASVFILSSTLGGIFNPMLLGYLFKNITPMWFIYLLTVDAGMCMIVFLTITIILYQTSKQDR